MSDAKREIIERIERAENELNSLYWAMRDRRGYAKTTKKLDTILGKLYNLKYEIMEEKK